MPEYTESVLQMGTIVNFRVISSRSAAEMEEGVRQAKGAMQEVEAVCSRFDETSELRQLSQHIGESVQVSDILFEVVRFSLAVAEETDGLFDPTLGRVLRAHGFRHHYLTGHVVPDDEASPGEASYRDVLLDDEERTVTLARPLTLDLGAVAKGFALDLAAAKLKEFEGYVIDAGGDVALGGEGPTGGPWKVGIRDPVKTDEVLRVLTATDTFVCTSGGYERRSQTTPDSHHLILPESGKSPTGVLSTTVMAPYGMLADAFSTVTFLLGCQDGIRMLDELELPGLMVDEREEIHMTERMKEYLL